MYHFSVAALPPTLLRAKRQLAEDSDYHYGSNHNAPHFVVGNVGDWTIEGGDISVDLPDVSLPLPEIELPFPNLLGILGGKRK